MACNLLRQPSAASILEHAEFSDHWERPQLDVWKRMLCGSCGSVQRGPYYRCVGRIFANKN